jgi:hypothetical protein
VGQALDEEFVGIATRLVNGAMAWAVSTLATIGLTFTGGVARPFAEATWRRDH